MISIICDCCGKTFKNTDVCYVMNFPTIVCELDRNIITEEVIKRISVQLQKHEICIDCAYKLAIGMGHLKNLIGKKPEKKDTEETEK